MGGIRRRIDAGGDVGVVIWGVVVSVLTTLQMFLLLQVEQPHAAVVSCGKCRNRKSQIASAQPPSLGQLPL